MNNIPKKTKYRKAFKGRLSYTKYQNGPSMCSTSYKLIALESGRIKSIQIEASRRAIVRRIKRSGKLWIRIFPDIPVSKKPREVRMGKGKGNVDHYICRVQRNRILFELTGVEFDVAKKALELGASKLPIKTYYDFTGNNT